MKAKIISATDSKIKDIYLELPELKIGDLFVFNEIEFVISSIIREENILTIQSSSYIIIFKLLD